MFGTWCYLQSLIAGITSLGIWEVIRKKRKQKEIRYKEPTEKEPKKQKEIRYRKPKKHKRIDWYRDTSEEIFDKL